MKSRCRKIKRIQRTVKLPRSWHKNRRRNTKEYKGTKTATDPRVPVKVV